MAGTGNVTGGAGRVCFGDRPGALRAPVPGGHEARNFVRRSMPDAVKGGARK